MLLRLQVVLDDISFIPLVDLVSLTHTYLYYTIWNFSPLPAFSVNF